MASTRVEESARGVFTERLDWVDVLARQMQDRATCDEKRQTFNTRKDVSQDRHRIMQVLCVVENQQQLASLKKRYKRVDRLTTVNLVGRKCADDHADDERGVANRCEWNEHCTVRE